MKTTTTLMTTLLATLCWTGPAHAGWHSRKVKEVTEKEQAWGKQLAKALGQEAPNRIQSASFKWFNDADRGLVPSPEKAVEVWTAGLRAMVDGVTVMRLRFESRAHALEYAARVSAHRKGFLRLVEVRGKQAVWISMPGGLPVDGWTEKELPGLRRLATARRAAWAHLAGPSTRDLLLVRVGNDRNDYAVRTVGMGPAHDLIDKLPAATSPHPTKSPSGRHTLVRRSPAGLYAVTGNGVYSYIRLDEMFQLLDHEDARDQPVAAPTPVVTSDPKTATVTVHLGAAKRLELGATPSEARETCPAPQVLLGYASKPPYEAIVRVDHNGAGVVQTASGQPYSGARHGSIQQRERVAQTRRKRADVFRVVRSGQWVYELADGTRYDPAKHGLLVSPNR